LQYY